MKTLLNKQPRNWLNIITSVMLVLCVGLYAAVPTHSNVSYGPSDQNWLNIYDATNSGPRPVFIWAHSAGGTANTANNSFVDPLKKVGITSISWESLTKISSEEELYTQWNDAELMLQWVKDNASKAYICVKRSRITTGKSHFGHPRMKLSLTLLLSILDTLSPPVLWMIITILLMV
jgi:hypothetical protein